MEVGKELVLHAHDKAIDVLQRVNPLLLTSATAITTYSLIYLWNLHRDDIGIRKRLMRTLFSLIKRVPSVKKKINDEIAKAEKSLHQTIHEHDG
ncbi:unnamed protein product, partial [Strongylus vulgaris]